MVVPGGDGSADLGPFKLGVINSNDLFPDYGDAVEAAVEFANAELNGLEGRQIELNLCAIDYNVPEDTQRCANELAAAQVDFVISTINQFGTHMQILRGAGIPVIIGTPVSVLDYTTEGVYALAGAGCAGSLTGMSKYAAEELGAKRIAIPYTDIPSGVLCYADSEQKPLDILKGTVEGATSPDAGSVPDLERQGFAIPPNEPDLTSIANQILAYEPDAIIFSAAATVCFPLLNALTSVGYSVEEVPFVMTTSCFDQTAATDAGESADGIYFVGSPPFLSQDPATLERRPGRAGDAVPGEGRRVRPPRGSDDAQLRPAGLHRDHEHGAAGGRGGRRRRAGRRPDPGRRLRGDRQCAAVRQHANLLFGRDRAVHLGLQQHGQRRPVERGVAGHADRRVLGDRARRGDGDPHHSRRLTSSGTDVVRRSMPGPCDQLGPGSERRTVGRTDVVQRLGECEGI